MRRSGTALSFLLSEQVRESVDSSSAPVSPRGSGVIWRRFSGTPLLPPLSSRLRPPGETEPSSCVVFTIGARGTEQSHGPPSSRSLPCVSEEFSDSQETPCGSEWLRLPS
uniref:Phosphodiesterase 4C n=1 Tax=Myotis myotis TaxID=51298 RepID=A0A7J7XIT9_MYOMY|nr:phosphodiesterase 4C [Myotis myotis]